MIKDFFKKFKKLLFEEIEAEKKAKKILKYNEALLKRKELEDKKLLKTQKTFPSKVSSPVSSSFILESIKNYKSSIDRLLSQPGQGFSKKVFCNHYVSPFKWFSGRNKANSYKSVYDALKAHLKYICNEKRDDLVLVYNDDLEKWKEIAEFELSKRWDSRIACKFFMTLPNSLSNEEALDLVKAFVENEIKPEFFTIAIHRGLGCIENKENLHAHVVFSSRDINKKKIYFNKNQLYNLRRKWEEYLKNKDFTIKTATWRGQKKVLNLYENGKLNEKAIKYIKTKRQIWALVQEAIDAERIFEKEKREKQKVSRHSPPPPPLRVEFSLTREERKRSGRETSFPSLQDLLKKEVERMQYKQMTEKWINDFTKLLYSNREGKIMILAIHPEKRETKQLIIRPDELKLHLSKLRKLNVEGYNIYATVNMMKENANSRKAENFFEKQTTIYLDFDSKHKQANELFKELYEEIKAKRLPEPSMIVKSSKGNYQIYYVFDKEIEFERLQKVMKALNEKFNLDATHDIARVFRVPGFRNVKKGKDDLVMPVANNTIFIDKEKNIKIEATMKRYSIEDFERIEKSFVKDFERIERSFDTKNNKAFKNSFERILLTRREERERGRETLSLESLYESFKRRIEYKSQSEKDIAFTIKALTKGFNEEKIKDFLKEKRKNEKRDVKDYAERTLRKAKEYLALKRFRLKV